MPDLPAFMARYRFFFNPIRYTSMGLAVTASVEGVNIQVIGTILMVVGVIGAVLSLVFWSSWGGFGGSRRSSRRVTRDDGGVVREDRYDDIDRAA